MIADTLPELGVLVVLDPGRPIARGLLGETMDTAAVVPGDFEVFPSLETTNG